MRLLRQLDRCRAYLPGLAERLDRPGAAFLDVDTGAAGIVIAMCRVHAGLRAVGLDISASAVTDCSPSIYLAIGTKRLDSGDNPYLDYSQVSPRLQQVCGPYTIAAGLAVYEQHLGLDPCDCPG